MSENLFPTAVNTQSGLNESSSGNFREAVCIDAFRVYDSCADKDCLQDLRVYFTEAGQNVIDQACTVRIKSADVLTVYVDLEPVPFNKGFYSVDMTFFFEVNLDVFLSPAACPVNVTGLSVFSKKVILFGSEGKVKVFNSGACYDDLDLNSSPVRNLPKATVQVAEPIGLSARVCCDRHDSCELNCHIPECICKKFGGEFQLKIILTQFMLLSACLQSFNWNETFKCLCLLTISVFPKKNASLRQITLVNSLIVLNSQLTNFSHLVQQTQIMNLTAVVAVVAAIAVGTN